MKIISKEGATATHTMVADEIKPLNGYYLPELLRAIGERYALQTIPSLDDVAKTGAKFQTGQFKIGSKEINITSLGVFNDGFNAVTQDTEDSEALITDLFSWLKDKHGFREPTKKVFRTFRSDLVVEFDNDPSAKLELFKPLRELLQSEMDAVNTNVTTPFQFYRFAFAYEAAADVTEFVIERRVGTSWNAKRYFCKAHITSSAHIKALELLEKLAR